MMDFSDVDRFAARLRQMGDIEREAEPILEKYGEEAGEWVNRLAPKRTRGDVSPSYRQDKPGRVTFPPYLVGEYRGTSQRGPNRRFLMGALKKVQRPLAEDVADLVRKKMKG